MIPKILVLLFEFHGIQDHTLLSINIKDFFHLDEYLVIILSNQFFQEILLFFHIFHIDFNSTLHHFTVVDGFF